jgi:hypothetical protein
MLALLATLSYTAGIASYFIGRFWSTRKIVRERILERNAKTMDQLRRFGGLLIILGRPHSLALSHRLPTQRYEQIPVQIFRVDHPSEIPPIWTLWRPTLFCLLKGVTFPLLLPGKVYL